MSDYTRRVPKEYYEAVDNGGKLEEITYDSVVYCADKASVHLRIYLQHPSGSILKRYKEKAGAKPAFFVTTYLIA